MRIIQGHVGKYLFCCVAVALAAAAFADDGCDEGYKNKPGDETQVIQTAPRVIRCESENECSVSPVSGGNGYRAKRTAYTSQSYITRSEFPEDFVDEEREDEKEITNLVYGDEVWAVIMSRDSSYKNQSVFVRSYFPESLMNEQWDKDKELTDLSYGDGQWIAVMSEGSGYREQTLVFRPYFPDDVIEEKWDDDKFITDLTYGDGDWVVVMSEESGYWDQSWGTNNDFPKDFIDQEWDDGKYITGLAYGDDEWAVIMSKGTGFRDQSWSASSDFPSEFIRDKWNEGKKITSIVYGDGRWAVVMSDMDTDCNGVPGGDAYLDECGKCVGGDTGQSPCTSLENGYMIRPELWIRAVINTEDRGRIEAVWNQGGSGITAGGHEVIWGYFYASPEDVSWGSPDNPDLFVKIWFDAGGRVDVSFFHVSVPDIYVYSEYDQDGKADRQADEHGVTTLSGRYIRQYYQNGRSHMEKSYEDGNPPGNVPASGNPEGYHTVNDLRIGAVINTVDRPVEAVWHEGGHSDTAGGHEVMWGYFYASPEDVSWGSRQNPDLFVKIWFDAGGRVDVNFFHVSVPDIEIYSDLPDRGFYDNEGTTILDNRYIRHEYVR